MWIPLRIASFVAVRILKLFRFHMKMFGKLITFPVLISSSCLIFAYQTITQNLLIVCRGINSYKNDLVRSAMRICWAVLCSISVFVVLATLLVLSFAVSGIVMASLTESPIFVTQNLYFDYTKSSASAVVPIAAAPPPWRSRPISRNHRIRLAVTLMLPESDHNRKLGVFQVRVESLSAKGEVIMSSSYPTMLRFKSQTIRAIESSIKIIPHITGMKSQCQNLLISVDEFVEGDEQTMAFRVSLEKRANLQDGCGLPEIYGAKLDIASKLPLLQEMVWNWRLTVFVWISFLSFMAKIIVLLLCCTPLLLPGRRSKLLEHFDK